MPIVCGAAALVAALAAPCSGAAPLPEPVRLSRTVSREGTAVRHAALPSIHRGALCLATRSAPEAGDWVRFLTTEYGLPPRIADSFRLECSRTSSGGARVRIFTQHIDGIPVWDSALLVASRACERGTLVLLSLQCVDPAGIDRSAFHAALNRAARGGGDARPLVLLLMPDGVRLARQMETDVRSPGDAAIVFADPDDGVPFASYGLARRLGGCVSAYATPGDLPDGPSNPPVPMPVPELRVVLENDTGTELGYTWTDGDGCLAGAAPAGAAFASVRGLHAPFLSVYSADSMVVAARVPIGTETLVLNDPPTPARIAQVNVFLQIAAARAFVAAYMPECPVLTRRLSATVNATTLPCNAVYGAGAFEFAAASGTCVNTAYGTIIHHEFGHALSASLSSVPPDMALDEGLADAFTVLMNDDPRIARELTPGDSGRDVAARVYHWPADLAADPHAGGLIVAGAWWRLKEALGAAEGAALGRERACRLFFDSLGLRPSAIGPELGWTLLFLDDDNGTLADGTPHLPQLAASFGAAGLLPPPWQSVIIDHTPLADAPLGARPVVRVRTHGNSLASPPQVRYRVNGGQLRTFALREQYAGVYASQFPALAEDGVVAYAIVAEDADGAQVSAPYGASLQAAAFHFLVGRTDVVFRDTFDSVAQQWQHAALVGLDEWTIGAIGSPAGSGDPPQPFSGAACAGIDLGGPGRDGDYRPGSWTYLRSPSIARPAAGRVVLRYARWLSVAEGDAAWVEIQGRKVWTSDDRAVTDHEWTPTCIDLTAALPAEDAFALEFHLKAADESPGRGGWHLDDIEVCVVTAAASFVRGDATGSGTLRIDDAIRILDALFGASLPCPDAADVNDDGLLTLADPIALLAYLFSGGGAPSAPFPSAGVDSTPDALPCDAPAALSQ